MTLATVYASSNRSAVHCLSIVSPDLDGGGYHWVLGWEPLLARVETGDQQLFQPGWFSASLPEQAGTGKQTLQFSLSNATGRIRRAVESVRAGGKEVHVIYRAYVPGHFAQPARVYHMTALACVTKGITATITAAFKSAINTRWPRLVYTQERFPGLRYYGG